MKHHKLTFLVGFLIILYSSMAIAASFDNVKDYTEPTLEDKYGIIEIKNWLGIGSTLAEYKLTYSSDDCLIDCYAEGTVVTTIETSLMSGFSFKSRENKELVIPHTKFIGIVRDVPYTAYDTIETCKDEVNKNTSMTYSSCTYSTVPRAATRQEVVWTEYHGEWVEAGRYYWKVTAKKPANLRVDWIMNVDDEELGAYSLVEWLWWDVNYKYKRPTGTGDYIYYNNQTIGTTQIVWVKGNNSNFTYLANTTGFKLANYTFSNGSENAGLCYDVEYGNVSTHDACAYDAFAVYNFRSNGSANGINDDAGSNDAYFVSGSNFSDLDVCKYGLCAGIIADARVVLSKQPTEFGTSGNSLELWFKAADVPAATSRIFFDGNNAVGAFAMNFVNLGGSLHYNAYGDDDPPDLNGFNEGVWYHLVWTCDNTNHRIYINGVLNYTSTGDGNACFEDAPAGTFNIGGKDNGAEDYFGYIDGVKLYRGVLDATRILKNYNAGLGTFGTEEEATTNVPIVTSNKPIDNYMTTNSTITFNCSATVTLGTIANITLNLDGVANYTESETEANATIEHTIYNVAEGTHTWNCNATGSENEKSASTNRALELHTSSPLIDITNYSSLIISTSLPVYTAINWTVTDTKFNSSWLYNGTNTSALCNGTGLCGITIPISSEGLKTYYIYANDSFNIVNSTSFDIAVYYVQTTYYEGSNTLFPGQTNVLTLYVNMTNINDTSAVLVWNGTSKGSGTKTAYASNSYKFENTFTVPSGMLGNVNYYWNFSIAGIYNGSVNDTQTVQDYYLYTECTPNGINVSVLNFTFYKEPEWTETTGNFSSTFVVWYNDKSVSKTYNFNVGSKSSFIVCLQPNNTQFLVDATIEYGATDYATREYYLNNYSLSSNNNGSDTKYVGLYLLATADGTVTSIYTYDPQDVPISDRYVYIDRYDVSTDTYRTVTIVHTDDTGHGVTNLRQNDAFYRFVVKAYPNTTELISDLRKITTTSLYLYPTLSTFSTLLNDVDSIQHNLTRSGTTFTASFYSPRSVAVTGCLVVSKWTPTNRTLECRNCSYGTNAILTCQFDNSTGGTFTAQFYNKLNPYGVWDVLEYVSTAAERLVDLIGKNTADFLSLAVILTVAMVFSFSPVGMVLAVIATVALLVAIGLLTFTLMNFVFLVIIGILIIARLKA